jgi:hypothetical protein
MAASTSTSTSTKTRARSGPAQAGNSAPRIDARMRFNWLEYYQGTVLYQNAECLINVGTRKQPFRGSSLTAAVNQGIGAMPLPAGRAGRHASASTSRTSGK